MHAGEEFMHVWPLHTEHIVDQLNPILTQPHIFPLIHLQLHVMTFRTLTGAAGAPL